VAPQNREGSEHRHSLLRNDIEIYREYDRNWNYPALVFIVMLQCISLLVLVWISLSFGGDEDQFARDLLARGQLYLNPALGSIPANQKRYLMFNQGHSGSSWFCSRIHAHQCAVCFQEEACGILQRSMQDGSKLPLTSFFDLKATLPKSNSIMARLNSTKTNPSIISALSKCHVTHVGGKCFPSRDFLIPYDYKNPHVTFADRETKVEAFFRAQMPDMPIIYLRRRNTLDYLISIGFVNSQRLPSGGYNVPAILSHIHQKDFIDKEELAMIQRVVKRTGNPLMTATYEDYCKDHSLFQGVYAFLGMTDTKLNSAALKEQSTEGKRIKQNHRQILGARGYADMLIAFTDAGIAHLMEDEGC
jgi:hypothetical protein